MGLAIRTPGRSRKEAWKHVDWALPNAIIARQVGVTLAAVTYMRKRVQLPTQGVGAFEAKPRVYIDTTSEERKKARQIFRAAVGSGRLVKKPCAVCGNAVAEGHHFDYRKPLEVIWLCQPHHNAVHKGAWQLVTKGLPKPISK